MSEEAPYRIANHPDGFCVCGHSAAAHGSNGYICAACDCLKFRAIAPAIDLPEQSVTVLTGPPASKPC